MDKILNILGLLAGFSGTLILWRYVAPSPMEIKKNIAVVIPGDVEKLINDYNQYKKMARVGLGLLALGFLLQFIAMLY